MKRTALFIIFALLLTGLCATDEIKQPTEPKPPSEPIVPGNTGSNIFPSIPAAPALPSFPGFPQADPNTLSKKDEPVREIEKYDLTINEAYPNGDTRRNVANTIGNSQYILYSNDTIILILNFRDGIQYRYHLSSPRSKTEISPGVYRVTYNTVVQAGKEFLLEQYTSELYSNENAITSIVISGNNKTVVLLKFSKKPDS